MVDEMATETQETAVTAIEKHSGNYEVRWRCLPACVWGQRPCSLPLCG